MKKQLLLPTIVSLLLISCEQKPQIESITLNAQLCGMGVGHLFTLEASYTPIVDYPLSIQWISSDESIVKIQHATQNSCELYAVKEGWATITCEEKSSRNKVSASCEVYVVQCPYDSNGALKGTFSVSASRKIRFSKGSLQYNASKDSWRFADQQYWTCYTEDNSSKSNWFDTFGWATSNINGFSPTLTSRRYEDYYNGMQNISKTINDWGYYNCISNGGNKEGIWRTITTEEWDYIINQRPNSHDKFGFGVIGTDSNTKGIILLPDDWSAPANCPFKQFVKRKNNSLQGVCSCVNYSLDEWEAMEMNGAVFLPQFSTTSHHWTSSPSKDKSVAWSMLVSDQLSLGQKTLKTSHSTSRYIQCRVRLVTDY